MYTRIENKMFKQKDIDMYVITVNLDVSWMYVLRNELLIILS